MYGNDLRFDLMAARMLYINTLFIIQKKLLKHSEKIEDRDEL